MKPLFIKILFLINIVAVVTLLLTYCIPFISPAKCWQAPFLGLIYPHVLLINLFFVVFWLIVKRRYLFISLLVILIGFNNFSHNFQFKGKKSDNTKVKVLSYNVRHFTGDEGDDDQKLNAEEIITFLEKENADIICLQETRLRKSKIFNLSKTVKELKNIQHYQFARSSDTYGSVTMTRYPIVDMGEIRFEESRNITIYTDILIEQDTVRVYNLHLQSYRINPKDYPALESMDINDENNRMIYKKVAGSMKNAFIMRAAQVEKIRQHIDNCPYPVFVCGDFNDTPNSHTYRVLTENLKDAFVNSGKGVGRTYVGRLPSFRIDYILCDTYFESYNFETLDFKHSDHLPIKCDFSIQNQ